MQKIIKTITFVLLISPWFVITSYGEVHPVNTINDISYIVGGTSKEEISNLQDESKKWSLSLEFRQHTSGEEGELLSGVNLAIINQQGKSIFDQTLNGPIFLVKLPPGRYELFATHQGVTKKESVRIKEGRHHRKFFIWRERRKAT